MSRDSKIGRTIVEATAIKRRVKQLAGGISRDYKGKSPLLIGVLKGAFVFMADLVRQIDLPLEIDFMTVSSYGSGTKSSGAVKIVMDVDVDLAGRDVILVEDIVDSGLTLAKLRKTLEARKPASLEVCSLLVRQRLKGQDHGVKYVGFYIPDDFVVGYGLDANQQYRHLHDIRTYKG